MVKCTLGLAQERPRRRRPGVIRAGHGSGRGLGRTFIETNPGLEFGDPSVLKALRRSA